MVIKCVIAITHLPLLWFQTFFNLLCAKPQAEQSQLAFTRSRLAIETLEKGAYMFKANNKNTRTTLLTSLYVVDVFWCFSCQLWTYFTPFPSVSIASCESVEALPNQRVKFVQVNKYQPSSILFKLLLAITAFNWYNSDLIRSLFKHWTNWIKPLWPHPFSHVSKVILHQKISQKFVLK